MFPIYSCWAVLKMAGWGFAFTGKSTKTGHLMNEFCYIRARILGERSSFLKTVALKPSLNSNLHVKGYVYTWNCTIKVCDLKFEVP